MMNNKMNEQPKRRAKQTRAAAKASLKSCYWLAVLACLIAAVLGATLFCGSSSARYSAASGEVSELPIEIVDVREIETWEEADEIVASYMQALYDVPVVFWSTLAVVSAFALILSLAYRWVGYCVRVGLCRFHLDITDGEKPSIGKLFYYFGKAFWRSVGMNYLRRLAVFAASLPALAAFLMGWLLIGYHVVDLWGVPAMTDEVSAQILGGLTQLCALWLIALVLLLLTLPVTYRFAMADFVLAENPASGVLGSLRESKRMMKGNKWRLFCLRFSFIGWYILCAVTLGIGNIFLAPYVEQAHAEFYHEISGRVAVREAVAELDAAMSEL